MPDRPPGPDPAVVARDGAPVVLARAGLRVALPLAVVLVLGAFAVRGVAGGTTAAIAAAVLLGIHVGTAQVAAAAGRVSPQALQAATLFGFLLRLGLYGLLAALLHDVAGIDGPSLAVVVVVLTLAVLAAEARVAARHSRLWWSLDAATDGPSDTKDLA